MGYVEKVIHDLENGDVEERRKSVSLLELMDRKKVISPLFDAMEDEDRRVQGVAARSMSNFCEMFEDCNGVDRDEVLDKLIELLEDDSFFVRASAAEALGEMKDIDTVDPLIDKLEDDMGLVQDEAAKALLNMGSPKGIDAVEEWLRE